MRSQEKSVVIGQVSVDQPDGTVVTTQAKTKVGKSSPEQSSQQPRVNRLFAILYVLLCFEMGAFLFLFPWMPLWNQNFFAAHYPWIFALAQNYYVRGAVSGLGVVDIFLAIHEGWRLRRSLGLVH